MSHSKVRAIVLVGDGGLDPRLPRCESESADSASGRDRRKLYLNRYVPSAWCRHMLVRVAWSVHLLCTWELDCFDGIDRREAIDRWISGLSRQVPHLGWPATLEAVQAAPRCRRVRERRRGGSTAGVADRPSPREDHRRRVVGPVVADGHEPATEHAARDEQYFRSHALPAFGARPRSANSTAQRCARGLPTWARQPDRILRRPRSIASCSC